ETLPRMLSEASSPDKALIGIQRFLEASLNSNAQRDVMAASPCYLQTLVTICSQSQLLTDIICRNPEYMAWLWEDAPLDRARTRDEMIAELPPMDADHPDEADRGLRRFWRREMLRIGVRDMVCYGDVVSLTRDLAFLADACIEAALTCAQLRLAPRYGRPFTLSGNPIGFVVLGMGKLGGLELNFSSDIDLLFLYSEEGETEGGRQSVSAPEYFQKLGEQIIRTLTEAHPEGQLFRVDMRLRPFGSMAPLCVSVEQAVEYYHTYGRAWERQALIKARPCAGDLALGDYCLERMRSFVFPRFFNDETLEDIRQTKRQMEDRIEREGKSETEVKLGKGGIRDIEFTVQMLQMLNGGRLEALRARNTLEVIQILARYDYLTPFEATALASNYSFLRRLEHRLQIEAGQQVHELPRAESALDELGRRLGYESGAALFRAFRDRALENRNILERFLAAKGSGRLWVNDLINPDSEGAAGMDHLRALGFQDPAQARRDLLRLALGEPDRPHSLHIRQAFADVAPVLIEAMAATPDPDSVLTRLERLLSRIGAPAAVYESVRLNTGFARDLITLIANSEYLSEILFRDPGLFDVLATPAALDQPATRESLQEELRHLQGAHDREAALYRLRDGEMIRVGMRELTRGSTTAQVGDQLTLLAEVVLDHALAEALEKVAQRYGPAQVDFAILGLGKLGGWEMGYGSDLDLLFVYDGNGRIPSGIGAQQYFIAVAAATMSRLQEPTRHGLLYNIDPRLRPHGKKGTLAVSLQALQEYFAHEAQAWERLALMKVRAVAGQPAFAAEAERAMKQIAFTLPLDPPNLARVEELRQRHAQQASPLDLKSAEGGISEVELVTRFWQLQHVQRFPALMRGDVFGALDILLARDLISLASCSILRVAYGELRRVVNRIRMMHGNDDTQLPENAAARADLAARLGIPEDLLAYTGRMKAEVHGVYAQVYRDLGGVLR
ncbi:MAG: bifunctional [glutamate--ammonia ligase]-adenylyl-L-tyrosine phosphorylase/[glutamate--ammonia-ligase] adenylyltransferase, partial [Candidatus Hydrogenedentes bacterium]|nr:bifunctional [glutamate--ammonia ligase]-adenylyl-L-tyrosine phosphorylase/[glutamate--ammonia-ligase] adenylyltransferase [Candidatus Hydrogenedentota bacterium]